MTPKSRWTHGRAPSRSLPSGVRATPFAMGATSTVCVCDVRTFIYVTLPFHPLEALPAWRLKVFILEKAVRRWGSV